MSGSDTLCAPTVAVTRKDVDSAHEQGITAGQLWVRENRDPTDLDRVQQSADRAESTDQPQSTDQSRSGEAFRGGDRPADGEGDFDRFTSRDGHRDGFPTAPDQAARPNG